jgi:hypothetical protein
MKKDLVSFPKDIRLIETAGAWPFITSRTYRHVNGSVEKWLSRNHRKGFLKELESETKLSLEVVVKSLWMPKKLNWWIGLVFAIGSSLFMLGSVLSIWPGMAKSFSLDIQEVNTVFFIGSIPFTTAAFLQLFQAAQAEKTAIHQKDKKSIIPLVGWYPHSAGWLSAALQFAGTILFNFSTFDAISPSLDVYRQDLVIWLPDLFGSILFLLSGYLAFIEYVHAYWKWEFSAVSWWVVFTNLLGCIAFMVSALFAFVPMKASSTDAVTISLVFTLAGGWFFFWGSLFMWPETELNTQPS